MLTVDVTERWAVPVTTPARTLIDLAAVAPRHLVEGALEDALHRKLVSVSWLERTLCIPSSRGRPGTGVVAELLTGRGDAAATESVLEDLLVQLLRDAGLPEPTRQHRVSVPGHGSVRIDVAFVPELVAIEGQGLASHSSGRDLQRDCDKRNLLVRLGWRVLAFTWRDVRYRPELVVVTVRSALAA
ncbi:MAG: endonuclease domain-containing protein [Acidimicrobiales bacterium]